MNKELLNQKLSDIEEVIDAAQHEATKLRSLINEPEQREPEAGDVYHCEYNGADYLLLNDGYKVVGSTITIGMPIGNCPWLSDDYTYLGKFSEVYVKISDVQDALRSYGPYVADCSTSALRKLNIITD